MSFDERVLEAVVRAAAAVKLDVIRVASLEDVIRAKEAAGRAKDKAVLPLLRNALSTRRAMRGRG